MGYWEDVTREGHRKAWLEDYRRWDFGRQQSRRDPSDAQRFLKYNLSPLEYQKLLAQQNGVCAICREPGRGSHRNENTLCVDHDHRTGRARALLCGDCNSAIGFLRESPLLARAAAIYLEQQLVKEFTGE